MNLEIALIAMVFSLIVGLVLALLRLSRIRGRSASRPALWVDIWRNLPLIFMILYLGARAARGVAARRYEDDVPELPARGLQSGRVLAALSALVLYNSAVIAEIMRAGILSLERGQAEAAAALGLTYGSRCGS